jgi:hypothetical protein
MSNTDLKRVSSEQRNRRDFSAMCSLCSMHSGTDCPSERALRDALVGFCDVVGDDGSNVADRHKSEMKKKFFHVGVVRVEQELAKKQALQVKIGMRTTLCGHCVR